MSFARLAPRSRAIAGLGMSAALVLASLTVASASSARVAGDVGADLAQDDFDYKDAEKCFMRKVNDFRAENGASRLDWDPQLTFVARDHAQTMANAGSIWHDEQMGDKVTRWTTLAQNTGKGNGCDEIFRAFVDSGSHRANMMADWRYMGAGTERRDGDLYVQHIFESRDNPGNIYNRP